MPNAGGFVERARTYAIGAVATVIGPELQAGLGVDMPCMDSFPIGDIVRFVRRRAEHDAFTGTFPCAFFTDETKIPDSEFNRAVRPQWQICKHLG